MNNIEIRQILFHKIIYENDEDIARIFNNNFCSIRVEIDSQIPSVSIDPLSYVNFNMDANFMFQPVSSSEFSHYVRTLENSILKDN